MSIEPLPLDQAIPLQLKHCLTHRQGCSGTADSPSQRDSRPSNEVSFPQDGPGDPPFPVEIPQDAIQELPPVDKVTIWLSLATTSIFKRISSIKG
jgi:hypothetical protein